MCRGFQFTLHKACAESVQVTMTVFAMIRESVKCLRRILVCLPREWHDWRGTAFVMSATRDSSIFADSVSARGLLIALCQLTKTGSVSRNKVGISLYRSLGLLLKAQPTDELPSIHDEKREAVSSFLVNFFRQNFYGLKDGTGSSFARAKGVNDWFLISDIFIDQQGKDAWSCRTTCDHWTAFHSYAQVS